MMTFSMVAAMARNRCIGKANALPWHLPEDLQHFKQITLGKPLIMGRKTFDSIGKPLPGRTNIVVTQQMDWQREQVVVAHSLEQAWALGAAQAESDGVDEVMIIGGAQIYAASLARVHRLYLTHIDTRVDGDAFFPEIDDTIWHTIDRKLMSATAERHLGFSFCVMERIKLP